MFRSRNILQNSKGYTLVEILIAMSVATIVIGSSMAMFSNALSVQSRIINLNDTISELNYLMNYISRNLRMAQYDKAGVCGELDANYNQLGTDEIYFKNQEGNCWGFYLANGVIYKDDDLNQNPSQDVRLTSELIEVKTFKVVDSIGSWLRTDLYQPRVTLLIEAINSKDPDRTVKLQTTISQASLDTD